MRMDGEIQIVVCRKCSNFSPIFIERNDILQTDWHPENDCPECGKQPLEITDTVVVFCEGGCTPQKQMVVIRDAPYQKLDKLVDEALQKESWENETCSECQNVQHP